MAASSGVSGRPSSAASGAASATSSHTMQSSSSGSIPRYPPARAWRSASATGTARTVYSARRPAARARAANRATKSSNAIGSGPTRSNTRWRRRGGTAGSARDRGQDRRRRVRHRHRLHPVAPVAGPLHDARRQVAEQHRGQPVAGAHDVRRPEDAHVQPGAEQHDLRLQLGQEVAAGRPRRHPVVGDAEPAEAGDPRHARRRRGGRDPPRALDVHGLVGVAPPLGADVREVRDGVRAAEGGDQRRAVQHGDDHRAAAGGFDLRRARRRAHDAGDVPALRARGPDQVAAPRTRSPR